MAARYVHNYRAFDRVLTSPILAARLEARGQRVAAEFRATAPVGEPYESDDHPGRFRDSVTVDTDEHGGPSGNRVNTRVKVNDPHGLSIEFGHHVKRDAHGRFSHVEDAAREDAGTEFIAGTHTLSNAIDAARD